MFLLTNRTVLYRHFPELKFFVRISGMDAKPGDRYTIDNKGLFLIVYL